MAAKRGREIIRPQGEGWAGQMLVAVQEARPRTIQVINPRVGGASARRSSFLDVFVAAWQMPSGSETVRLLGMEPHLAHAHAQLMAELAFRLPPGYHVRVEADELILRRFGGSIVDAFSGPGTVPEVVERAANEDLRRSLEMAG